MPVCAEGASGRIMFTGLIEELGAIGKIDRQGASLHLTIRASTVLEDIKVGASIAVNGVCLTVTDFRRESFSVDVVPETLARTTFPGLKVGERVNLERAIRAGDRLGGHLVTGHIDGIGKIKERRKGRDGYVLRIAVPPGLTRYLISQGSIAVDGVSLTVVENSRDGFTVAIIPHTAGATTLGDNPVGNHVNIEVDSLNKYVEKLVNFRESKKGGMTADFLKEQGF